MQKQFLKLLKKKILSIQSSVTWRLSRPYAIAHMTSKIYCLIHRLVIMKKKTAILSLIKDHNSLTIKLLDLLTQNKRVYIVNDIANSFIQLYNSYNDIKEAVVITASPINKDLEEKILSKINISDLKSINLKNIVKPEILGGFIIRFDGKEYNASVKQNLNNLKTQLTN